MYIDFHFHTICLTKIDGQAPLISEPPPTSFTNLKKKNYRLGPLGRVGLVTVMSVCIMSPFLAILCQAFHWPSDNMISSRPLIGQPSFPPSFPLSLPLPLHRVCLLILLTTKSYRPLWECKYIGFVFSVQLTQSQENINILHRKQLKTQRKETHLV